MRCIAQSLIFILPLGLTQHQLGQEPRFLMTLLFLLGFFRESDVAHQRELAVDVTFPGKGVQQCMFMLLPVFKSRTFNHVSHSSTSKLREECNTYYEP
jgi:hypothetical protein